MNDLLASFTVGIGGEEAKVLSKISLKKLDVFLVLADRQQLVLQIVDGFYLHELFGNFAGHSKRLKQLE